MAKKYVDKDVLTLAKERISYVYDHFESIWVSFSGGKDSTVVLNLAIEEAQKRGKKVNVLCIDLEGHYTLHREFVERTFARPEVEGYWVCLPFLLANASSVYQPKWLCWDKDEKGNWVHPMPDSDYVIHEDNNPFPFFEKGMEFEEFIMQFPRYIAEINGGKPIAQFIGIRTDESFNRYLKMKVKQNRKFFNDKQYILYQKSNQDYCDSYSVHPIYDWGYKDVWKYLSDHDYNETYDRMYWVGYAFSKMRICQPYGEEQRENIDLFHKIEPETWERIQNRVSGGNFAKIYRGKNVLGVGRLSKPDDTTWEQWGRLILQSHPPYLRDHYLRRINVFLKWYRYEEVGDIAHPYKECPEDEYDEDGLYVYDIPDEADKKMETKKQAASWRRITKVLIKNDYYCKNLTFTQNKKEYEKIENLKKKYQEGL